MNNTVEFLDSVKERLKITFDEYYKNRKPNSEQTPNKYLSDEEFRKAVMIIRKTSKKFDLKTHSILYQPPRTVVEFLDELIMTSDGDYRYYLSTISDAFNTVSSHLEENLYEIEIVKIKCDIPPELNYQSIIKDLENCENRISNDDYSGAITSAKTLVEGVVKELLTIFNQPIGNSVSLTSLFSSLSKHLNLDASNDKYEKSLKKMISGFTQVVQGISEVRNQAGDSHSKKFNPSFHHAVLTVNSAKTITSFLFHTYEYQRAKGTLSQFQT